MVRITTVILMLFYDQYTDRWRSSWDITCINRGFDTIIYLNFSIKTSLKPFLPFLACFINVFAMWAPGLLNKFVFCVPEWLWLRLKHCKHYCNTVPWREHFYELLSGLQWRTVFSTKKTELNFLKMILSCSSMSD